MTPKEQSLQRQLVQAQASIPQLTLEKLQADTQRDQAEATLRNAMADLDLALDVVVNNPPPVIGPPDPQYDELRRRFPNKFRNGEEGGEEP